jgi:hypothetical protein|nr:MAG TPA: hypothetical protein [Caudoviricetes sp.]
MNEQQITRVDENNLKARAILQSLIFALEKNADPGEEINVLPLVEAACDYLDDTNRMFQERV